MKSMRRTITTLIVTAITALTLSAELPSLDVAMGSMRDSAGGVYRLAAGSARFSPVVTGDSLAWVCAAFAGDSITGITVSREHGRTSAGRLWRVPRPVDSDSRSVAADVDGVIPAVMCYEPKAHCFYAWYTDNAGDPLWAFLDASTLQPAAKPLPWPNAFRPVALAINDNGTIYAVGDDGVLYRVHNESGNATAIGDTGVQPSTALQGMCFDESDSRLIWAAQAEASGIYSIDIYTGAAILAVPFLHGERVAALAPVTRRHNASAPATPRTPVFETEHRGDLHGNVVVTVPARSAADVPYAGPLSVTLYIDGIVEMERIAEPGTRILCPVELTPGSHWLAVTATHDGHASATAATSVFAGFDRPQPPREVVTSYEQDKVHLSWVAPDCDVRGKPLKEENMYFTVTRRPDGKVVGKDLYECYVTDSYDPLGERNRFSYEVTCRHDTMVSEPAASTAVIIGRTYVPDFRIDFRNPDSAYEYDLQGARYGWEIDRSGVMTNYGEEESLTLPPLKLNPSKVYSIEVDAYAAADSVALSMDVSGTYGTSEMHEYGTCYECVDRNTRSMIRYDIMPVRAGNCTLTLDFRLDGKMRVSGLRVLEIGDGRGPARLTGIRVEESSDGPVAVFTVPSRSMEGVKLTGTLKAEMVTDRGETVMTTGLEPGAYAEMTIPSPALTEYVDISLSDEFFYKGPAVRFYPRLREVRGAFADDFSDSRWLSEYDSGTSRPEVLEISGGRLTVGGGKSRGNGVLMPLPKVMLSADSLYTAVVEGNAERCSLQLVRQAGAALDTLCVMGNGPRLFRGSGGNMMMAARGTAEWRAQVDKISVMPYCNVNAPALCGEAVATALDPDTHSVALSFRTPLADIAGNPLEGTVDVEVQRVGDAAPAVRFAGMAPGVECRWTDKGLPEDVNEYEIVAVNAMGKGMPVKVSAYSGWDAPAAVSDLKAVTTDNANRMVWLSWQPPVTGLHGAPVNQDMCYEVYSKYGVAGDTVRKLIGKDLRECGYGSLLVLDSQREYVYEVRGVSGGREGAFASTDIVVGTPDFIPLSETFAAGHPQLGGWSAGDGWEYSADVDGALLEDDGAAVGRCGKDAGWLMSPLLNLNDVEGAVLSLKAEALTADGGALSLDVAFAGNDGTLRSFAVVEVKSDMMTDVRLQLDEYIRSLLHSGEGGISRYKARFAFRVTGEHGDSVVVDSVEVTGRYAGIEGVEADAKAPVLYDLQGRRLTQRPAKGEPYIVNGKKVMAE